MKRSIFPWLLLAAVTGQVAAAGPPNRVSLERGFAPVVQKCLPAVVNVSSSKIVRSTGGAQSQLFSDPLFQQLFGDQFSRQVQKPRKEWEESLGSGVIVSSDGYILTNEHVVDGASHVKIVLGDQREFEAHIVGKDAATDIAVLKVDATGLPILPFGDSGKMRPGDFVLAIGNPFGLSQTVTMGIVSAVGRGDLGIEDYEDFIQTDAAINPGNSGGALINVDGELIGINTAILSGGGGNQGVGFAIPINMARAVMDQILNNGHVVRGWLGITLQPVTAEIEGAFGLSGEPRGALVADVASKSPAAEAGLATGDIILELNGQGVPDSRDLSLKIAMMAPETTMRLKILRNGVEQEITVSLGEEPTAPQKPESSSATTASAAPATLGGVTVIQLTPDICQQLHLPLATRGVILTGVDSASFAAEAGLEHGDVIEQVNHEPISSTAEFQAAILAAGRKPTLLLVSRGGSTRFVVVEPD
jgi:serine protease Do